MTFHGYSASRRGRMQAMPLPMVTAAQMHRLAKLGIPAEESVKLTRREASMMIDRLQKERDAGLR